MSLTLGALVSPCLGVEIRLLRHRTVWVCPPLPMNLYCAPVRSSAFRRPAAVPPSAARPHSARLHCFTALHRNAPSPPNLCQLLWTVTPFSRCLRDNPFTNPLINP